MNRFKYLIPAVFVFLGTILFSEDQSRAQITSFPTLQIGINYENTVHELQNCINDVRHVKKILLTGQLNVRRRGNLTIMIDKKKGTNRYPTAQNIRFQLRRFVRKVNRSKQGFFQYSGHGSYLRDTNGDELDARDEILVPIDSDESGYIRDDEIFSSLIRRLNKGVSLTMLVDSCNSGTVADLPYKWSLDGRYTIQKRLPKRVLNRLPNVIMISACRDDQLAYDGGTLDGQSRGAGAMTAAFLTILDQYNYNITYRQLLVGMESFLRASNFPQTPQLSSTRIISLNDKVKIGNITLSN